MKTLRHTRRPLLRLAAVAAAGALVLSACGQAENLEDPDADADGDAGEVADDNGDDDTDDEPGEATIRFSWWGSDTRHTMNQEVIDAFMEEYPHITVVPDYTDWGGYWDKLATQTAGGDTPDVLMQEERYLREYASRGVLANLDEYDIDTSQIDETILGSGEFDDGLWGIATGVNVRAMIVDPQIFEDAGVDFPDDATWTWDDYAELSAAISENSDAGVYGTQEFGFIEPDLSIWLRQHGQNLWNEDGEIGFDAELMAQRWQMSLDLIESGAAPSASESLEISAGGPEQSLVAMNNGAISMFWSNQLGTLAGAADRDLQLLRYPGETEFDRTGLFLKPAMALSMSESSDHPEEAALFIDWMLNSEVAGEILLTDRGLPANMQVREAIVDLLPEDAQQDADWIADVTPEILDATPSPPTGAGEVAGLLERLNEQVLFGQLSPEEAAEQFVTEAAEITGD